MLRVNTHFKAIFYVFLLSFCICSFAQSSDNSPISENSQTDDRLKIRLGFVVENSIYRQILLTVDDRASMGYDWGFDGPLLDVHTDDLSWIIEDDNYVIQGIDNINVNETFLPLALKKGEEGSVIISIDHLLNVPDDLGIYLYDMDIDTFYDLRDADYETTLNGGQYNNRYYIVFQNTVALPLSTPDNELDQLDFYYATSRNKLIILNPENVDLENFELYDVSGKEVFNNNTIGEHSYNEYQLEDLSAGVYIVKLYTKSQQVLTKKIVVK